MVPCEALPMKRLAPPISAPLTFIETAVLRAATTPTTITAGKAVTAPERLALAKATQALVARGFLAKTKAGLLATPEGLAALLDTVPIDQLMRHLPLPLGASTTPSTARRTSAASSSRRARASS